VSRIENDPVQLAMVLAEAGPDPEVALEACYGWYWAADLLQAEGAKVHLVHPLGLHRDTRRVKNDVKDATEPPRTSSSIRSDPRGFRLAD
jgi:transposase